MKKSLLLIVFGLFTFVSISAQSNRWKAISKGEVNNLNKNVERESFPSEFNLFQGNLDVLKVTLLSSPNRLSDKTSNTVISLPNMDGKMERYTVYEFSNFDSELQSQYPDIRSYVGFGIDDIKAQVRISLDPRGIQAMVFRDGKRNEFIEPYSEDGSVYAVYQSSRKKGKLPFTCSTQDSQIVESINTGKLLSSNGVLKTFRLALSCTAEYSNYFGATSALQSGLVLAAFNATMTRVNGVYEIDLAIHMNITANSTNVIYYNAATDPYSNADVGADGAWNGELQTTLTNVLGVSTYDIGHLFGASGGGGNAGCIGCVCSSDGSKGSAFTSPGDNVPAGDTFDIDYVAHEMGHQFGGNHTFSHGAENNAVNVEPGSGSTIMAYAGITGATDVQSNSDAYFAYRSILQIQTNLLSKTCSVNTTITHSAPVVDAGSDWTIPRGTPFKLTGSATDAGGGTLTYCWEQNDDGIPGIGSSNSLGATGSLVSTTKTTGPNFRSRTPQTVPYRYMPKLQSVLNNTLTADWESVSDVARTLNFTLTVRDNVVGGGQTNTDAMVVTVNGVVGPFDVTSQNTDQLVWAPGSSQNITWTVNGTTSLVGSANVDILLSTDGGQTFNTTLASSVPNNGSYTITVPSINAPNCRIMVKPTGNIYFDINTKNIAIGNYVYEAQNVCSDYVLTAGVAIPESSTSYTGYGLTVTDSFILTDINIKPNLTHPNAGNLYFAYRHPSQTSGVTRLSSGSCAGSANINLFYDQQGAAVNCSNTTSMAPTLPLDPFTPFIGLNSAGQWVFFLVDIAVGDGITGTFNDVTFNLCRSEFVPVLKTEYFGLTDFALYPNPNNGNFIIQFSSETSNDVDIIIHDLRGRQVYSEVFQNRGLFNQEIQLKNASSGIYLVTVQDGNRKEVKKIVVE